MSLYAAAKTWADNHPEHVIPPGFSVRGYSWTIALAGDGTQIAVTPAGNGTSQRKVALPNRPRTSGSIPLLVHDKVSYLQGAFTDPKKGRVLKPERPPMYRALVDACFRATADPLVGAVLDWFDRNPVVAEFDGIGDEAFRVIVDGRDPVAPGSAPARWWPTYLASKERPAQEMATCMVCGAVAPQSRLLPPIKGVEGATTSGAPLTSINNDVFASYGASEKSAFSICPSCAHATGAALNYFTADEHAHLRLAGNTVVWWQPDPAPVFDLGALLSEPDGPEVVHRRLTERRAGREASTTDHPDRFCAAILTGNAGRISVTGWLDTTIPDIEARIDRYFTRTAMIDRTGFARPPTFSQLARSVLADHAKTLRWEPARRLVGSLLQAILAGSTRPPHGLAGAILNRTRQGQVTHARAAGLKLALCPDDHSNPEVFMTQLDPDHPSAAYQCGRLLAVIERIQADALGDTNTTVVDKYYGTFSSRPKVVFGRLVNGAQPHLAKLRKTKRGTAVNRERELSGIIDRVAEVPSTLTLEQQAEFALGFYHQRQDRFSRRPGDDQGEPDRPTDDHETEIDQ